MMLNIISRKLPSHHGEVSVMEYNLAKYSTDRFVHDQAAAHRGSGAVAWASQLMCHKLLPVLMETA